MSTNKSLSVVIPNWNGKDVILDCLKSVYAQDLKPSEVIVVDNGSSDGSAELIRQNFPDVQIIGMKKNIGFAGGVNVGIKAARSKYVFLLNNDAICDHKCFKNVISTATKKDAQIVQALILNRDGKKIDSSGDVYSTWGLPFPEQRDQAANNAPKQDRLIFSACAGACLYKKSLFEKIGYFDEMFFAYYEDVDLSMRAQLKGIKIWLSASAKVFHRTGHSSRKVPGFGREMAIRNSIYIFWKDLPLLVLLKVAPRFIYSNLRLTLSAIKNGYILQAVRAHLSALVHMPAVFIKRFYVQKNRNIKNESFYKKLSKVGPF